MIDSNPCVVELYPCCSLEKNCNLLWWRSAAQFALEFGQHITRHKRDVARNGGQRAIVVAHYAVALAQRGLVVAVGEAAVAQETYDGRVAGIGVDRRLFKHPYTPVIVGTEAVGQIVGLHKVAPCGKRLVAHQHAAAETAPREVARRREVAHAHHAAGGVDKLRLSIYHTRVEALGAVVHALQRIGAGKAVARVQKHHIASPRLGHCLVHGVIQAPVGLAPHAGAGNAGIARKSRCAVGRRAILHQPLKVGERLLAYAAHRGADDWHHIVGDCDY